MSSYREAMVARFWRYHKEVFRDHPEIFERSDMGDGRPPVFLHQAAESNVLMAPDISEVDRSRLLGEVPVRERHRWFRSMSSSQAIALSVFGNLKMYGLLGILNGLHDEQGCPIFGDEVITPENFRMEYKVDSLGEPRPTSLDALIAGKHPVAIECKLTEPEVGSCSRPRLTKHDSNYEKDLCDGTYTVQRGRATRCSLTEIGVNYWSHIPAVFKWTADADLAPCPMRANYQLVRNLLAVSVLSDAMPSGAGHVVLVYDDRNPAFQKGGKGAKFKNALIQDGFDVRPGEVQVWNLAEEWCANKQGVESALYLNIEPYHQLMIPKSAQEPPGDPTSNFHLGADEAIVIRHHYHIRRSLKYNEWRQRNSNIDIHSSHGWNRNGNYRC